MIRLYRGAVFKDLSRTGGSCRGAARGRACRSPVSITHRLAPSGCCHPPGAPLAPTGGRIQPHPLVLTGVYWVSWGAGKGRAVRAVPCPATVGWGSVFWWSQCPPAGRQEGQDTSPHPFPQRSHRSRGSPDQTCVPGQFPPQTGTRREELQVMAPRGSEPADASRGDKGLPETPATLDPLGFCSRVPATQSTAMAQPRPTGPGCRAGFREVCGDRNALCVRAAASSRRLHATSACDKYSLPVCTSTISMRAIF